MGFENFMAKAASADAKPEEVGVVGVSERVKELAESAEYKKMIQQEEAAMRASKETEKILRQSTSTEGTLQKIPLDQLTPTPEEWNQFSPLSDDKKVQLAQSILQTGLQQPIVVRAMQDGTYQILAGNTRTEIYRYLHTALQDRFASIPAIVYPAGAVDDVTARQIVTDTNYVQRAELSKRDRAFAIHEKLTFLRHRGEEFSLEKTAELIGMSRMSVYLWECVHNLIDGLFAMYDREEISIHAAARLGGFPEDIQQKLFEEKEYLTNDIILQIPGRTKPGKVMDVFHTIIDKETNPETVEKSYGDWRVKRTRSGIRASVKGKCEGYTPYVILLPNEKAKRFVKKYEEYILKEDDEASPQNA